MLRESVVLHESFFGINAGPFDSLFFCKGLDFFWNFWNIWNVAIAAMLVAVLRLCLVRLGRQAKAVATARGDF
jgi:hypothetical protein